jgi:hypothetical protein
MRRISFEELLASQEGLCSVEELVVAFSFSSVIMEVEECVCCVLLTG